MKKSLIVLLFFFLGLSGCKVDKERIIGIKIYEYNNDFNALVSKWKTMKINTAFISDVLAGDNVFRQVLKRNGIKVFLIFPVFFDPGHLQNDSTLYAITDKGKKAKDDWVEFVCPSRTAFRKMKIDEAADRVQRLKPDGLSIDFIRQFVFWEIIYPGRKGESIDMACFCDSCISSFCRLKRVTIPDTCVSIQQKASYILRCCPSDWNGFRCDLITSMVKEISEKVHTINPDIKINLHAVPWRDSDFDGANIRVAAQNMKNIEPFVDYISPMCYSQMVKRDALWIESVVSEMDKKAPGKIIPSIQVFPYYIDDTFTVGDFQNCVNASLKGPSKGVVFFSWPLFEKDPTRMEFKIRK